MSTFEILLLLFFFGIPILEGVLRKGRKGGEAPPEPRQGSLPGQRPGRTAEGGVGSDADSASGPATATAPREAEAGAASDMVPDDLWELLTGERRSSTTTTEPDAPSVPVPVPVLELEPEYRDYADDTRRYPEEPEVGEPVLEEWSSPSGAESLEYVGPEAYSLEQPIPPPEVRHQRFHDRLDALGREIGGDSASDRVGRRSRLLSSLRSPAGLRQAVLLKEVLGQPKGLE